MPTIFSHDCSISCPSRHSPSHIISSSQYQNHSMAKAKHFLSPELVIKGVLHPNQKLTCFVLYLKIINTFLKNNIFIVNCPRNSKISRPSSSWVIDQNNILTVLIHNSKKKKKKHFAYWNFNKILSSLDNLL